MPKIKVLDALVANMIAAGEVVDRPASVVKELVENAIDAGANRILVEVNQGGRELIKVTDNGCGILPEDCKTAFLRHATSKIFYQQDLTNIKTLGFRGEALASICAVSKCELITKVKDTIEGTNVIVEGGEILEISPCGAPEGTTVMIRDLFYNTPARFKFMKKDSTEHGAISDLIEKFVLSHPEISFRYIHNAKEILYTPGDNVLKNSIYAVYGAQISNNLLEVSYQNEHIKINGYIGKPIVAKASRKFGNFFVNGRLVGNRSLNYAVEESFKERMMVGKYPFFVLNIEIATDKIDVNVHPNKSQIKFEDEQFIYRQIYTAVKNALYCDLNIVDIDTSVKSDFVITIKDDAPIFEDNSHSIHENNAQYQDNLQKPREYQNTSFINETIEHDTKNYKIIGQAFNTYIVIEKENEILFLDQHAAHERLTYEELKNKRKNHQSFGEILLSPYVVKLSGDEFHQIVHNSDLIESLGFNFEEFGNNSLIIRQTPLNLHHKELVEEIFTDLAQLLKQGSYDLTASAEEKALFMIACKASVKGNMKLSIIEIEKLVDDVLSLQDANSCPHGRPLFISYTKTFIEKQFKRI